MNASGVLAVRRRRRGAEVERLVSEFEQSGQKRREFCAAHGLCVHTLDAWRKRVAQSRVEKRIVPVEIVEDRTADSASTRTGSTAHGVQFGIVLDGGVRIAVEAGFDAAALRRLITALGSREPRSSLAHWA